MSKQCLKHPEYEYLFLNLSGSNNSSRLLCEICIQEQTDTFAPNLVSINTLKSNNFNQYQKLLQFADEEKVLIPHIKFDLIKDCTLEKINTFYDDIQSSFLKFVESKRENAQKCYYGLFEAQTKLLNLSRLDDLKSILKQNEGAETITLSEKINEFFSTQINKSNEIKNYLQSCVNMTNQLDSFQLLQNKVADIKEKVESVLKMEDDLSELTELSQKELHRVQHLKEQINNLTLQLQKLINRNFSLKSVITSPLSNKQENDLYKIDAINKAKGPGYFMKKIEQAILNNKYFLPLEIVKSDDGLIFSRTQPGKNLLGLIDIPIDFDVFGQTFKVKVVQGFVAIGVCARDINVKRGYRYDVQLFSPSSGFSMLTTSGYTISSFNAGHNNAYLKLHYSAGSVLEITPCDNKITFYHENFGTKDFPFDPQDDITYCPCFMLSENSSIEFLLE